MRTFNRLLDALGEFLAHRKGLLPIVGIMMIFANLVLQFVPGAGLVADSNLLLHLGVITAIIGFLLAWAL